MMLCSLINKNDPFIRRLMPHATSLAACRKREARREQEGARSKLCNFERAPVLARPASFLSIRPSRASKCLAFTIFEADGPTLTWLGALVLLFWRHPFGI